MDLKDIITIVLTLGSIIVSVIAIIKSKNANKKHDDLLKHLNSKEYELNENLKEIAVQIIAVVRSIDAKTALAIDTEGEKYAVGYRLDYSYEINLLSKLLSSPGYILFLKAIDDDEHRYHMENYLHKLFVIISSDFKNDEPQKIRSWCLLILQQLNFYKIVNIGNTELCKFIDELSMMKGILTKDRDIK